MTKLDEITVYTPSGHAAGIDGDPDAKQQIKILMLETFGKALEAKSIEEMAETFRKEVEAL